jgi:adenosine deaminase
MTDWFDTVPKVELHLHLEGAIPHDALFELMQKYGGDPSIPNVEALKEKFRFDDFAHFIELWIWKGQFIREYEDYTFFCEAIARDLARQNIRYVEAFCSPGRSAQFDLETPRVIEAIRAGLDRVPEVAVAIIPDLVRDFGPLGASITLEELYETKDHGVIGIGIGGSEQKFPPELFEDVFRRAREMGFHTTAHAGEAAGAESIWGAVRSLEVERIGHGTRAEEDDLLLEYLVEHQIALEMCPLSNVATNVVDSIGNHPVRRYFDRGLLVTVNTDDPMMFHNSLAQEYRALADTFGFARDEIRAVILNGVKASWLPEERKRELAESFQSDTSWRAE